jgi:hypothetical protein
MLRGNAPSSPTATYVLRLPQSLLLPFTKPPFPPLFLYLLPRTYPNPWLLTEPSHRLHRRTLPTPPRHLFQRPPSPQQNLVPHLHPMKTAQPLESGHGRA